MVLRWIGSLKCGTAFFVPLVGTAALALALLPELAVAQMGRPMNSQPAGVAATPVALTQGDTSAHHGLFAVKVTGQGPAVILIPGLSSSGDVWEGTVEHLKAHYQCHVLTLAGFAGEPAWSDIKKGGFLPAVEDEIAAYIRQNNLKDPIIIGHSLGGTVAVQFAERYPDVPGKLVIVDMMPFLAGVWLQAGSVKDADPVATNMKLQIEGQTPDQYQAYVKSGASTRAMVTSDADFARVTAWGLGSDQHTMAEAMYELLTTDERADLGKVRGPMLVFATWAGLQGVSSQQVEALYRSQYQGTKQMKLVMAGQERHFIMLDNPSWFFAQLDAFLSSPGAAGSAAGAQP